MPPILHTLTCGPSVLLAAEAPQCSSEFGRWPEPSAGGGLPAPRPARVAAQLCGWFCNKQLANSAFSLHHRVGKLCEEHRSKVQTPPLICSVLVIYLFSLSDFSVFFLTHSQKRPSTHHRVWNRSGCHLCFLWEILQSLELRLRWVIKQTIFLYYFYGFSSFVFVSFVF